MIIERGELPLAMETSVLFGPVLSSVVSQVKVLSAMVQHLPSPRGGIECTKGKRAVGGGRWSYKNLIIYIFIYFGSLVADP